MEGLGVVVAIGLTIEVTRLMMILVLGPLGLRLRAVARHRMMAISKSRKDDSFHTRYTFPMLQPDHAVFLVRTFNVRTSKIKQWCEEIYICMDKSKNFKTNIDPLLSTLTSKDRDTYHKAVKKLKDENEIKSLMPWGPSGAETAFDRGYEAGLASVRRDHKTKGGQSDPRAVRKQVNHTSYAYGPSRHEPLRQKDLSPYHKSTT